MTKPTVHYIGKVVFNGIGYGAFLTPIDHKNHLVGHSVSNHKEVLTSPVISYDEASGRLETQNTVYEPATKSMML